MSLPYFYEPGVLPNAKHHTLSEESVKHAIQVLRMKAGEALQLTDGKGHSYTAIIKDIDKRSCTVAINSVQFIEKQQRNVAIGISLLKNASRFEWFLEKATEIGVSEIIPLLCQRTERQHFRFDRMQGILVSAMLQSQQVWLPLLHMPEKVTEVIEKSTHQQKLIAHCEPEEKKELGATTILDNVLMLIGPEGDFSPDEIKKALLLSFFPVALGNTRLRTETAGVVAAALMKNL
jgi:16S rRNA (uracil1498-N3)-methyltransferase